MAFYDDRLTGIDGFLQIFNCLLLTAEAGALLMVQPAQLLQNLGVGWIAVKHAHVGALRGVIVFLLFVYMAYLEPDILLAQGSWWIVDNVLEALRVVSTQLAKCVLMSTVTYL